ncbi:acyl-CoA dehydrogenase family protein [Nocardioides sp. Bht2]|uniref:acyl-CoA dehydrogenase family protein n=1 Tax=Nocardioides sp. Bht2 TaxID=3392297 RepID=UPI0039B55A85
MPIALSAELRDLADVVQQITSRSADPASTRDQFSALASGAPAAVWPELVDTGLLSLHLPEPIGGGGAGLMELAVVAEAAAAGLLPGAWLPTVLASYALAQLDAEHKALHAFEEGATGALVMAGLRITQEQGRFTVEGTSLPTLGLPGAQWVVVRSDGPEPMWFLLGPEALRDAVIVDRGVDLTRSIGRLDGAALDPDALLLLGSGQRPTIDLAVAALFAAEAAGVSGWAVRTGVDYATTRIQFDRPIGAFQATQHKAAQMLVTSEVAATAAWDAARAETQSPVQQQLAAHQAALNATFPAVEVTLELVTLLGGIGFTWEHDAHLYWRRALSLAALAGTESEVAARLGAVALGEQRDFTFLAPDALPELRAEVGAVLDRVQALPAEAPVIEVHVDPDEPDNDEAEASWQRVRPGPAATLLAEAGLVAPHYPAPYGRAADVEQQAVIADEFAKRGLRQPSTVIGEWALPTLLEHGTAEQQERFVAPTLRGEIFWCQLFSEPGAGSDLASLRTKATKVDGGWRLQGQKVWTSGAHEAQWGICLARSDASAPKHRGISYFLVDLASPGVEVRPLKQATGRHEFNEVFLDDVFVPDDCLVGEREQGWRLAATTLANERLQMGGRLTHGGAHRLRAVIDGGDYATAVEVALAALGRCTARENALSALNLRAILARLGGLEIGAEISVAKVFNAAAQRQGTADLLGVLGPAGALTAGGHAIDHLGLPAVLFGGGTTEIQLNVIAQRVLGLPREGR